MRPGLPLRCHLAVARLARKSLRKSPKRPLNPNGLPQRFVPPPPIPARRARLSVTQTRVYLGGSAACCAQDPPPPTHRAAPFPFTKNVTVRPQSSRGIRSPVGREGEEQGLGAAEAAPGTRAGKDQCPGRGCRGRERAQALRPPGFGKRCTTKG